MALLQSKLEPGSKSLQVGVTSWVGKKLYHGFRAGYFDAKSYDLNYNSLNEGGDGEATRGFWATPSFALAKTFGGKGGVVECYLDVKRAITFNLDALAWVRAEMWKRVLDKAGVKYDHLANSRRLYERNMYMNLMRLDAQGKPLSGMWANTTSQLYPLLDQWWDYIKVSGYDGVCLPEKGVPTVAATDFSQVTYGKRVKEGDNINKWDAYDVSPLGQSPVSAPKLSVPPKPAVGKNTVPKPSVPSSPKPPASPLGNGPLNFRDKDGSVKPYSPQLVVPPAQPVRKPKKDDDGQLSLFDSLHRRFGRFLAD
jgi:hypothetical protein